jgi:uncharacterized membrane protein
VGTYLQTFSQGVITSLHALAVFIIVIGTVQSLVVGIRALRNPSPTGIHFRTAYLLYARWLIGALTLQLAADIVQTAITPVWNWDEIGHLAAIAVIRTFLNFFLERDVAEMERHCLPDARDPHGTGALPTREH